MLDEDTNVPLQLFDNFRLPEVHMYADDVREIVHVVHNAYDLLGFYLCIDVRRPYRYST